MTRTRVSRRFGVLTTAAVAAVGIAFAGLVGAPAASATTTSLSLAGVQATGVAGITQNLTIQVAATTSCGLIGPAVPVVTVVGNANGVNTTLGTAQWSGCVGATYTYTYQWVPNAATVWYLFATADGVQSTSVRSAISPVPVVPVVSAPGTVKQGSPVTVSATVTAQGGSLFSPQGTVTFAIAGGATIGTATLNQAVPSVASISWTPAVLGAQSIVATYTPAGVGTASQNTTCATSCTSAPDAVQVTASGVNMYLANPPAYAAGVPATLTAVVSVVPPSGTVTFTVNGAAVASNVPVNTSTGQATATWTPPAAGTYTVGATWAGANNLTGTASETISVSATPSQTDQIIVRTSTGTTLAPGQTYTLGNGTVVSFTASTASGAAPTFTTTGPCTVTPTTFIVNQGSGQCVITAKSPGGNGYGPVTASVTVALVPGTQTATLAAPATGSKYKAGTTITLEKPKQGKTKQGQPISWKITKGNSSVCSLVFADNGAVKLKIKKKGYCNAQATAPAVKNQWAKFTRTYQYQGT